MSAQEYLDEIEEMRTRIGLLKAELDVMMESINLLPGVSYDGVKIQTTSTDSKVIQMVIRCSDKRRVLLDEIEKYEQAAEERVRAIKALSDPKHIEVLTLRYIRMLYFWEVAREMSTSESNIYRWHREALAELEAKMKEDEE